LGFVQETEVLYYSVYQFNYCIERGFFAEWTRCYVLTL